MPFRMNMLFFVVFILFSLLVLRLGVVQIVKGEDYKRRVERTEDTTVNIPVPRGEIFDRNGQLVVGNSPLNAITYTRPNNIKAEDIRKVAEDLSKYITLETDKITERDKKDYWLLINPEEAKKKMTVKEEQKLKDQDLKPGDIYKIKADRVTEEEINTLTEEDLKVLAIYREFNSGYPLTPQIVKNKDVTAEEFAIVSEHLDDLPGVDVTTDWDRYHPFEKTLQTILGSVSSSKEGLPREMVDYYLAREYNRNDRVGKSYLERQYEDVLHGQKEKVKNVTKSGDVLSTEVVHEGKKGKDLVLTIDMDLQIEVEKIIEEELLNAKSKGSAPFLDRAFVVLMDPYTGEILTLAGKQYAYNEETGKMEFFDFATGNFTTSYAIGSSVKGATILTGFMTGGIKPRDVIVDQAMNIKGTPTKSSLFNKGSSYSLTDLEALERSSNVYMYQTAIRIGKGQYRPGLSLKVEEDTLTVMRSYFNDFGLGTSTGLDLPGEQTGFRGPYDIGKILDFSIGQYDTYTPLQLAQYIATIANGGNRMQAHLVKEIREPTNSKDELGPIVQEISPKVLNRLDAPDEWVERVQDGLYRVVTGSKGTARNWFKKEVHNNPAGKTGTAEAFYDGPKKDQYKGLVETNNLTFAGYAPYDHPEVAISVVVPWAYQGRNNNRINQLISERVLEAYFTRGNLEQEQVEEAE